MQYIIIQYIYIKIILLDQIMKGPKPIKKNKPNKIILHKITQAYSL